MYIHLDLLKMLGNKNSKHILPNGGLKFNVYLPWQKGRNHLKHIPVHNVFVSNPIPIQFGSTMEDHPRTCKWLVTPIYKP